MRMREIPDKNTLKTNALFMILHFVQAGILLHSSPHEDISGNYLSRMPDGPGVYSFNSLITRELLPDILRKYMPPAS